MSESTSRALALIAELQAEGEAVDAGAFTIDAAKAAEKFAKFRYQDRQRYLAHIVEGLRGMGSHTIVVDGRRGDVEVHASLRQPLTDAGERLYGIYAEKFAAAPTRQSRGLARVAVGIDMGLGLPELERVVIEAVTETTRDVAVYVVGEPPEVWTAPVKGAKPGLHLTFDLRARDELKAVARGSEALAHLRDAVGHSPLPIRIDDIACQSRRKLQHRGEASGEGWELVYGLEVPPRDRIHISGGGDRT